MMSTFNLEDFRIPEDAAPPTAEIETVSEVSAKRQRGVRKKVDSPLLLFLVLLKNIYGYQVGYELDTVPTVPEDLMAHASRVNAMEVFIIIWKRSVREFGNPYRTDTPVVHIHGDDRDAYGLSRENISAQIRRLAAAGLIEIVDDRPGIATNVRLAKRGCQQ
jgi:hypothetical protein